MQPAHPSLSPPPRPALYGKTVLIADDDEALLRVLAARCRGIGLTVETATDGLRTLLKVAKDKPDLLILDLNLPDVDGFRVVERLTDPKFPPLPVVVLTGRADQAALQRCEELGVLHVQKGPDSWEALEATMTQVFLEKHERESTAPPEESIAERPPRILVVDDDPLVLKALSAMLQKYLVEVVQAPNGMQGFWLTLRTQPDLVITDYNMDQGSGHYLLSRIKSTPSVQHIPVIVFTGQPIGEGEEHAVRRDLRGRGQAAAFVTKRNPTSILEEIRRHLPLSGKS